MKRFAVIMTALVTSIPLAIADTSVKYVVVDVFDPATHALLSVDSDVRLPDALQNVDGDVRFIGQIQTPKHLEDVTLLLDAKLVRGLQLKRDPSRPEVQTLMFQDKPLLAKGKPVQALIAERPVRITDGGVLRRLGQTPDSSLIFSSTDDPLPAALSIAIVAVPLICGARAFWESYRDDCLSQASRQCGQGKIRKIARTTILGLSIKDGAVDVGCGQKCEIDCSDVDVRHQSRAQPGAAADGPTPALRLLWASR
jgi:hypothetical protein